MKLDNCLPAEIESLPTSFFEDTDPLPGKCTSQIGGDTLLKKENHCLMLKELPVHLSFSFYVFLAELTTVPPDLYPP